MSSTNTKSKKSRKNQFHLVFLFHPPFINPQAENKSSKSKTILPPKSFN